MLAEGVANEQQVVGHPVTGPRGSLAPTVLLGRSASDQPARLGHVNGLVPFRGFTAEERLPTPTLVSSGCCHLKQAVGRGIPAADRALASLEAQDADVSCAELEQPPSCGTESQPGAC